MLYLDDETRRRLRGYQDQWLTTRNRQSAKPPKPKARQLNKEHRRRIVDTAAAILKQGDPTPFAFEGFCRHDIRSGLCLKGWAWADADAAAQEVVSAALRQIGATRPTWLQGQPEHTQEGFSPFERTRCVTCNWHLPEGHRLYCSQTCFEVKRHDRRHKWENAYDYAVQRETRWITALGGSSRRG